MLMETTLLGPIILHSQDINSIKALDEHFDSVAHKYIEKIRSDGHNLYIDFKPFYIMKEKARQFISPEFVLKYKGESFQFTHQFYDV